MARQIVYRGRKIQLARDTETLPDGGIVERDIILHPGAVAILPWVDAEHVCLVRNRRPNVGQTLLEIPAGTLEPAEPPDTAAQRELAEETGYQARTWVALATFFPSPGVMSERTHLYLARDLIAGRQQLERDEDLHPEIHAWTDVVAWCLDGTIQDAKTLVAVLLWERRLQPGISR